MNADVAADFYAAVNAEDGDAIAELIAAKFAADVELIWPSSLPYGGTVRGAAKLGRLFFAMAGAPAPVGPDKVSVVSIVDGGDQVAARLEFDWYAPGSNTAIASGALELWTFVDGRVTEIRAYYWDTAELIDVQPVKEASS